MKRVDIFRVLTCTALSLSCMVCALTSCSNDDSALNSVFIPDDDDMRMPAYTEMGYNTFGARLNRGYFNNTYGSDYPLSVMATDTSLRLDFVGVQDGFGCYNWGERMIMTFEFPISKEIKEPTQLVDLDSVDIDLADMEKCCITIEQKGYSAQSDTSFVVKDISSGFFKITRIHNIMKNDKYWMTAISGRFEFKYLQDDKVVSVSDGRFDLGITEDNFYRKTSKK